MQQSTPESNFEDLQEEAGIFVESKQYREAAERMLEAYSLEG